MVFAKVWAATTLKALSTDLSEVCAGVIMCVGVMYPGWGLRDIGKASGALLLMNWSSIRQEACLLFPSSTKSFSKEKKCPLN
jgi:hypothetical protein